MESTYLNLITSIKTSAWAAGFRHVHCSRPECHRWLTQRHLSVRPVGVNFRESWYCSYRCVVDSLEAKFEEMLTSVTRSTQRNLRMPLGLVLVSRGSITEEQLRIASERHRTTGEEVGELLLGLGFTGEAQVTAARSAAWSCPVFTPPARVFPSAVTIPATLMRMHAAVPMHNNLAPDKLLVGFLHRVDYGLLYATEQLTGRKTTPCFLAPADHRCQTEAQTNESDELLLEELMTPDQMTAFVCRQGARLDANHVAMVRCGGYIWVRLKGGTRLSDLLFRVS